MTGTNFVIEEVRLEWMPLSTSASTYEPPVARFHIQHYRDLPISTTWVSSNSLELFSANYNKKLASSWLKVFWSLSFVLKGTGSSTAYFQFTTKFHGNDCSSPITTGIHMDAYNFIIGTPIALMGVCEGISAGDVVVSLVMVHWDASPPYIQASWNQRPHLIIEEISDASVNVT